MTEPKTEAERAWEALEAELWPEGPAHGSGSGVYAKHKPRIQAAIEAEAVKDWREVAQAVRDGRGLDALTQAQALLDESSHD